MKKPSTARAARTRASAAQEQWNGGALRGAPRPQADRAVGADCPTDGCGDPALPRQTLKTGWVRIQVSGSTEPARRYCSGHCASIGIALAERRMTAA